ncbi:MAG: hypothetical protein EU544_05795 [Promethearchaeota archaeon]|nr:MAG: hypothetical protein EU544_05795 [Candidatus Lokiarchaeota archaeon]
MTSYSTKYSRSIARDFLGKVEMAKNTPLKVLERMFNEIYDEAMKTYLRTEHEKYPHKSQKQILIKMYEISERLKGRKKHNE